MKIDHSLDELKSLHNEAMHFFEAELMLLKEAIPKITDDRISKAAQLLIRCGQNGAALFQLANQLDCFSGTLAILARSFMETIINFCYVCVCDEKEYRAFLLHPIYKNYHNIALPKIEDDLDFDSIAKNIAIRKERQEKLKVNPIIQEALTTFSESKSNLNWTKKNLNQRIDVIKKWGKIMDCFFSICKIQYYSNASEAIHGTLYGCTYNLGVFDPFFDNTKEDELNKKIYKDNSCILIHLGILIHESLTLISYKNDIEDVYSCSYENRTQALNLFYYILGNMPKLPDKSN